MIPTPQKLDDDALLAVATYCHALGIKQATVPAVLPNVAGRIVRTRRTTEVRLYDLQTARMVAWYRVSATSRAHRKRGRQRPTR